MLFASKASGFVWFGVLYFFLSFWIIVERVGKWDLVRIEPPFLTELGTTVQYIDQQS